MMTVAGDCSGIETPLMALDNMNIKYNHVFSSDIDKSSKLFIENNFKPKYFFNDIKTRNNDLFKKSIDMYIAGFPCQTFSTLGTNAGFNDKDKGTVFFYVYDFIKQNKPKIFILENVKNLKSHDKGNTFKIIMDLLSKLDIYNVFSDILSTEDYGIPQSRKRLYIVGIRKDVQKQPFTFPKPVNYILTFDDFIDHNVSRLPLQGREPKNLIDAINKYKLNESDKWILNLDFSRIDWFSIGRMNVCPCLTTKCDFYITYLKGKLLPDEALKFQGINVEQYDWTGISDSKKYKFAGNCMSVNVLVNLYRSIFIAIV